MAIDTMPDAGFFEKHGHRVEYGAPSGCWLWSAGADSKGYGSVSARGKMRKAHREAYEAIHGAGTADGLVVRHKCDTPSCVNPSHLETGTVADNNRDRDERGRQVAPCLKGSANGQARLTEGDVRAIRAAYVPRCRINGGYALARRFGVAHSVVGDIVRREKWRHV